MKDIFRKNYNYLMRVMKKPNLTPIEDYEKKLNNRVIILSFIIIILTYFHDRIELQSYSWIRINNFTVKELFMIIFIVNTYFMIQYVINIYKYYLYNKIRLTGINFKQLEKGLLSTEGTENLENQKNSTLYYYLAKILENNLQNILKRRDLKNQQNIQDLAEELRLLIQNIKIINQQRINVSLENFDQAFRKFLKIQNLNFWVFYLTIPIVIYISSLIYSFQLLR